MTIENEAMRLLAEVRNHIDEWNFPVTLSDRIDSLLQEFYGDVRPCDFSIKSVAADKGYTKDEIKERWGIKERQYYNVIANPKQIHIDAVNGLPRKKKSAV
jgi:hypothetical protein